MGIEQKELMEVWEKLLGRTPDESQFDVWIAQHDPAVVRYGIMKTAAKNLALNRLMDDDHRARYASSVMNNFDLNPRPLPPRATTITQEGNYAPIL